MPHKHSQAREPDTLLAWTAWDVTLNRISHDWVMLQHANQGLKEVSEELDTGQAWEILQLELLFFSGISQLQLRNPFLPHTQVGLSCIPPQDRFALRAPKDCWCQSSPGMGLAQCCSMQDVSCCLLRHLPSKLMYPAVMLRLCCTLPIHVHWPTYIGLSTRVWARAVQRTEFIPIWLQMQGPSTAYQPEETG